METYREWEFIKNTINTDNDMKFISNMHTEGKNVVLIGHKTRFFMPTPGTKAPNKTPSPDLERFTI